MSIAVRCPHCQAGCQVDEIYVGGPVQCFRCKKQFTVHMPGSSSHDTSNLPPMYHVHLDMAAATSSGVERERNEDSFLILHRAWANLNELHELALAVVADGMGGHEAGDRASQIAIRTMGSALTPLFSGGLSGKFRDQKLSDVVETLDYAVKEANRSVFRQGESDPNCSGMGACIAAVLLWDGQVRIEHVGDCRVYHYRANQLQQITIDQTVVGRMVALGKLTAKEAKSHTASSEVTQALGKRFTVEPDTNQLQVQPRDWLLVCCDGLQAHVEDEELEEEIVEASSALELARNLVNRANRQGGSDNCTVIAIRCA